jgi:DNA-binding winged helix-turn-helix (wHTH) protein/Tol biopolymer transport system component
LENVVRCSSGEGISQLARAEPLESGARRQYRFGEYQLDLEHASLKRGGEDVVLRAKSFDVLAYLVERPGRLVTKTELIDAVWRDVAVADNSLAQCILEIRRALDDEAQQLIRTVARRGYIFEAAVTAPPLEFPRNPAAVAPILAPASAKRWNWGIRAGAVLFPTLAASGILLWIVQRPAAKEPPTYTQITSFTDSAVAPALSPDGRMVAFYRSDRTFFVTGEIYVKLLPNGEPVQLTHDPRQKYNLAFSPDGSRIAYTAIDEGPHWKTYTVSSLGGDSTLLLSNAAGLSWLDDHHLLFSEVKTAPNMGIVTATENRSSRREIYFPAHQRGMAHYSYASPDRKWALVVEMDPDWLPCRLIPLAGGSPGRQVGPAGACKSAGWSPDGTWMYFGVGMEGKRHLWRQRFPDGKPEQMTSGPEEEDGVAVAPDGRSLITSIFMQQGSVWMHDSTGDRAVSSEGYAVSTDESSTPFSSSADGRRLYYLLRRDSPASPAELWRFDRDAGRSEAVVSGFSIREYDISSDEKEVLFSTRPAGQASQIWLAPLDRSAPPQRIAATGEDVPRFGPNGQVLFRLTDGKAHYLARMGRDGGNRIKVFPDPIVEVEAVSPDRRFAIIFAGAQSEFPEEVDNIAVPIAGGPARHICRVCAAAWSPDGKYLYIAFDLPCGMNPSGRTLAIPVPAGETLPPLPAAGISTEAEGLAIPGARVIDPGDIIARPDPSTYAYVKSAVHANLFRLQLR